MLVRKFGEKYNNISEIKRDIIHAISILKSMREYIDFMIQNDEITDEEKNYLQNSNIIISQILKKYDDNKNINYQLEEIQKDFNEIFEMENTIFNNITKRLWQNYTTDPEQFQKQGDHFAYIVHYVEPFEDIKLTHPDEDFISATLSTDSKWGTCFARKVGLILDPKRYNFFMFYRCWNIYF